MTGEQLCWRTAKRVGLWTIVANLDGAAFTFAYLAFLVPVDQPTGRGSLTLDVVMLVVFLVVSIFVIGRRIDRDLRSDLGWVIEDRAPTEEERDATLALPFRLSALPLVAWLLAAVLWGACGLLIDLTAGQAAHVVVSIALGGLVTSLIAYLLNERQCRPLFVLALADGGRPTRPASPGVRARLLLTWALVSGVPLIALLGLPLHGDGDTGPAVIALSVLALAGGGLSTLIVAKAVAEPLADVRRALAAVEAGDLSVTVAVDDGGEVGMLQTGVNRMVAGLRERARLADLFGRHVGTDVAALALEQGTGLQSEQREASALFVDLIGSTAMAEVLPPADVVETLNAYFATVVQVVGAEGGWVNKFEGDGALCIFGAPATQPDHAARALRAARRLHDELRRLSAVHPGVDAAIGVSSGTVVAGNVGTESRYEYTVIGRPVNEAARLTELAKDRESRVLASGAALARAGDEALRWVDRGTVALRGRSEPTVIAEPASGDRLPAS